jgi:hypothetical protein
VAAVAAADTEAGPVAASAPDREHAFRRRSVWLSLGAITALGFVVRLVFLGVGSLGYEESFTASIVAHAHVTGVWNAVKGTESTPPLYYVLTWLWVKIGGSAGPGALRGVSLVAGAATVPASFAAARQFLGTRLGLGAALLTAVNPLLVGFSIYARSYALMVLVATLSVWTLGLLLERATRWRWALWVIAAVACLWTHYFLVFLLAGEIAVLLVTRHTRTRLLISGAAVALLTAPLWPVFLSQTRDPEKTAYIAARSLSSRLEATVRQFAMGTNVPTAWLEGLGIAVAVGGLLVALARVHRMRSLQILLALALFGAGLPIFTALTGIDDHFLPRNVLGVWIGVAGLAACGLMRPRAVPLLAYAAICLVTVLVVQTNWRYRAGPDWNGASSDLRLALAGNPVAVIPGLDLPVGGFYLHRTALDAPLRSRTLWVVVEPERGPGQRGLGPVPSPPLEQLWGSQFRPIRELDYRGFRAIELSSPSPATILPRPADDGPVSSPLALVLGP